MMKNEFFIILLKTFGLILLMSGSTAAAPAATVEQNLRAHVTKLAGEIGERNIWRPRALRGAADYIRATWQAQGYRVAAHEYRLDNQSWANLEIARPGNSRPAEIVVIGAHYDTVPGSPGANDNGSGVAALLEIARCFAARRPDRSVRFVAFVNEEPPFFRTGRMGSRIYAGAARERGEDIRAMLSLETIGYYSDEPGSQSYPPLFGLFYPGYPERGNFVAFVSNLRSRALLEKTATAFHAATDFPAAGIATFAFVPGVDWSDHGSFWRHGYPALMVTDTALYRYPHYHSSEDTPDKVNYGALARVTQGLCAVVEALAHVE